MGTLTHFPRYSPKGELSVLLLDPTDPAPAPLGTVLLCQRHLGARLLGQQILNSQHCVGMLLPLGNCLTTQRNLPETRILVCPISFMKHDMCLWHLFSINMGICTRSSCQKHGPDSWDPPRGILPSTHHPDRRQASRKPQALISLWSSSLHDSNEDFSALELTAILHV